jgi:hypothetical protein
MWRFKHAAPTPPGHTPSDAINDHDKRLDTLADRMAALERRFTKLQGEMSREWRDRYERNDDVEYEDEEEEARG